MGHCSSSSRNDRHSSGSSRRSGELAKRDVLHALPLVPPCAAQVSSGMGRAKVTHTQEANDDVQDFF